MNEPNKSTTPPRTGFGSGFAKPAPKAEPQAVATQAQATPPASAPATVIQPPPQQVSPGFRSPVVQASQNPFGASAPKKDTNALAETLIAREVQEVQAQIIMAKKFPRDPREAYDRIMSECDRPTLAEHAIYSYAKGGTDISGPSIRLAETIARNWGNIQYGIREIEQRDGESTVEAFAWDLETNVRVPRVFQVKHIRHTRTNTYKLTDPREIYELVANQGSRRVRACILELIPGDVVQASEDRCRKTLETKIVLTPERIKAMTDAFAQFGVTQEMIELRIQRKIAAITPAGFVQLTTAYNSLRDGVGKVSDFFQVSPESVNPETGEVTQ